MSTPSSIIIGADQGNLYFMPENVVAHAITPDGKFVYAFEDPDPRNPGLLYYPGESKQALDLPEKSHIRARRIIIDFDSMHDNEIDARWHGIQSHIKNGSYTRVMSVSKENKTIDWMISIKKEAPIFKTTPWTHKEQALVCTTDFASVDRACYEYRVNVTCTPELGVEPMWTAKAGVFIGSEQTHKNRSRAVIQSLLLAHYQRDIFLCLSPDQVQEYMKQTCKLPRL